MKYFNELSDIESNLIKLQTVESLLRVVANSQEYVETSDVNNSIWVVLEQLESTNESLKQDFQTLWDKVAEDSKDKSVKSDVKPENSWVSNLGEEF